MKRYLFANWKENPLTLEAAKALITGLKRALRYEDIELVIAPPVLFLPELARWYKGNAFSWGVQNISHAKSGAYTGEVSAAMLKPYAARYAIVGHSERRALGETDELIAAKITASIRSGLYTVLCVGEATRNADGAYMHTIRHQLERACSELTARDLSKLIIAYEPLWAIGKGAGEAIIPADLLEMLLFLRKVLTERYDRKVASKVPMLYGGSVKPDNAASFIVEGGAQGLLVGSASLDPVQFSNIITAVHAA